MVYMGQSSCLEWWEKTEISQQENERKKDIYGFLGDDVRLTLASTSHLVSATARVV